MGSALLLPGDLFWRNDDRIIYKLRDVKHVCTYAPYGTDYFNVDRIRVK